MSDPAREIEQLRKHRAFKGRDVSIDGIVSLIADDAARTQKKIGELVTIWEELVPPEVASHTAISGFRAGVLHVVVDSSSAAYDVDRLLRAGLFEQLCQRFRSTLVRVKVRVGAFT